MPTAPTRKKTTKATPEAAKIGHAAHTKAADSQKGLPGEILRPIVITFMGAGSNFCSTLTRDVLRIPGAEKHGGEFRLCDIDPKRLKMMHKVVQTLIDKMGLSKQWKVRSGAERRKLLPGSTYAVCCVEVSGVACVAYDNDIPLKYGIDQCIGDTVGPGGLFKGLRTVPVFLDILRDMAELCPGAIMLNYTNPMSMLCLAAGRAVPEVQVVGLCHSVQGTSHLLARYAEVPYSEMDWDCAGINHLAWFTKLRHNGQDLYPRLIRKFQAEIAAGIKEAQAGLALHDSTDGTMMAQVKKYQQEDLIRKDMCVNFGAFITESSGHLSEYLPYYRKSDAGRQLLRLCYHGGSRFYATNWPTWRQRADAHRAKLVSGEEQINLDRSWEYASWIIEAREKDSPFRIYGNVMNAATVPQGQNRGRSFGEAGKLITNLPGDAAVEVACMIDRNGVNPTRFGALPAQMAHICASNMAFFDLAATAIIEKSKEAAAHALMLDPLSAAVCTPAEIRAMTMELFKAEKEFLPGYK